MRRRPHSSKAGFTLIEALITLAITSVIMGLLATIGSRGGQTGFRLGARALDVADNQVATQAYRSMVNDFIVPPLTTPAQTNGGTDDDATTTTFTGATDHVEGLWLAARAGPCGPAGATGHMTLAVAQQNNRSVLTCQLDDGDAIVLADLKWSSARFWYSEDGVNWVDSWEVDAGQPITDALNPTAEQRKVYVRVASDDGVSDMVEIAASGRAVTPGQVNVQ